MSEKQVMINILEKMPNDISMADILETLNLIHELKNRIDDFDEDETISQEDLKKEIEQW